MASQAELYSKFSSFPDGRHVQAVCKLGQGARTCRYLAKKSSLEGTLYKCEKASQLRSEIDDAVEQKIVPYQSDNCAGTLGFVAENQQDLVGHTLMSEEIARSVSSSGSEAFSVLTIDNGKVSIGGIINAPKKDLEVRISTRGITFVRMGHAEGLGDFLAKETILFEAPQE